MDTSKAAAKWAPYLLSALRIAVGIVFIRHGMQRLFGFPFVGYGSQFPDTQWNRWAHGLRRRLVDDSGPLHAACRFRAFGDDGRRVLCSTLSRERQLLDAPE